MRTIIEGRMQMTDEMRFLRDLVNEQAEDVRVWFGQDAAFVKFELRKLHEAVERALESIGVEIEEAGK